MKVTEEEEMGHKARNDVIHTFQVNFFAMGLLNTFPWDFLDEELATSKTSDIIIDILQKTCLHPICLKNPPSLKYRRRFLTELIKRHEMISAEPLDVLYEALGQLMFAQEEDLCYKTYLLPTGDVVSLAENVALISQGTTGLVTWEAAMYLAEWALENTHIFKSKTVLELGSGIGLTGIVVCRSTSLTKYIFSDCHQTVLQRLKDNITNCLTNSDSNSASVSVEELDWENVSDEQLQRIQANTIIAAGDTKPTDISKITHTFSNVNYTHLMMRRSLNHVYSNESIMPETFSVTLLCLFEPDVVYDPDIIACLVKLLSRLLNYKVQENHPDVYIASAVRNPQTYDCFKKELERAGLRHVIMKDSVTQIFPYNRASTIEMIKIYV